MKKFLFLVVLVGFISACGGGSTCATKCEDHKGCDTLKHDSCCTVKNPTTLGVGQSVGTGH